MPKVVFYHGGCMDGFCAAWVLRKVLPSDTLFVPSYYGTKPGASYDDKEVYVVDFSFDRETMIDMIYKSRSFTLLDHHKTANEKLIGLNMIQPSKTIIIFDMERSGAGIAWDYFFMPKNRPFLVNYVEDRDLWRFKLPGSRDVNNYISLLPITDMNRDGPAWDATEKMFLEDIEGYGTIVTKTIDSYVKYVAEQHVIKLVIPSADIMYSAVLTACAKKWVSEVMEHMLGMNPDAHVAISFCLRKDGTYEYSLRSREDGPDVSIIAKAHGGGGHTHAAGFQSDARVW